MSQPATFTLKGKNRDELKKSLVAEFEAWLDEILAEEAVPEGIAQELLAELEGGVAEQAAEKDAHALWSAMTALNREFHEHAEGHATSLSNLVSRLEDLQQTTREVGEAAAKAAAKAAQASPASSKESITVEAPTIDPAAFDKHFNFEKHFKKLEEGQSKLLGETRMMLADLAQHQKAAPEPEKKTEAKPEPAVNVDLLVGIRDVLHQGREVTRGFLSDLEQPQKAGFFSSLFGGGKKEAVEEVKRDVREMMKGYTTGIDQIDTQLRQVGIQEIKCEGTKFNGGYMTAVEVEQSDEHEDGLVIGVIKPGYRKGKEVLRPAQVRVVSADGKMMDKVAVSSRRRPPQKPAKGKR